MSIEDADLGRLNDLLRAHADVDVTSGRLSVYSELRVSNGRVDGRKRCEIARERKSPRSYRSRGPSPTPMPGPGGR